MYKAFDIWLPSYLRQKPRSHDAHAMTDILLCLCDHFEIFHDAGKPEALARLDLWKREFPRSIESFRDADGCRPRHTFFYPVEQYDEKIVRELAGLCRASGAEVELHLHHERDEPGPLRQKLERGKMELSGHGLLPRDPANRVRYGFIHGDWALDNSHPQGLNCGVSNELAILKETGCYADFTMPSAPDPTQTRIINSLYYAADTPAPKSHDTGVLARVRNPLPVEEGWTSEKNGAAMPFESGASEPGWSGDRPALGDLLLVQGPLGLNWERRKFGLFPRIENGDLTGVNPPRPDRMRLWLRLGIHVQGRPEWRFIKLHTHGAMPANARMLLGDPMRQFHEHLRQNYHEQNRFRLHYVTARELVNILHAAEDGHQGNPGRFRDYWYRRSETT